MEFVSILLRGKLLEGEELKIWEEIFYRANTMIAGIFEECNTNWASSVWGLELHSAKNWKRIQFLIQQISWVQ